ncbi:MAG: ABC transporter permease [Micromonosporaceae bacterium]
MNVFVEALRWLNDPLNWTVPGGILERLGEHLWISAAAVLLGCLVAWPVGVWLGHTGRGGGITVVVANVSRALPTLALLTLLTASFTGIGPEPVIISMAVFAIPPLLANAYLGLREIDPEVRDAARGMGLSGWQLLWQVELPLSVPYLATGFRTATVQVVATTTLAVFVGGGGLGTIIAEGIGLGLDSHAGQVLAGGLLVASLAMLLEGAFALAERTLTPRPLRQIQARARGRDETRPVVAEDPAVRAPGVA